MLKLSNNASRLLTLLQAGGPSSSASLASRLGVSQPTLSRLLAEVAPLGIRRMGAARSTRYALRRKVRELGDEWPIYRVSEAGIPKPWGTLVSLHGGFQLDCDSQPAWAVKAFPEGLTSGLPFYLQDVRPQGFLGRAVARRLSAVAPFPQDPDNWSDDDALSYFLSEGDDLPGDFVLGDRAMERVLMSMNSDSETIIAEADRATSYTALVERAHRGNTAGSSAGGDQPKFLARVRKENAETRSVLVKFSPLKESSGAERWADLLVCEHLAAEVIAAHGVPSARSSLLDFGNRRFLEVERFDRTAAGGRRGVLTLGAITDGLLDETTDNWIQAGNALHRNHLTSQQEAQRLRWTACFGELIANTDMHRANASFWFTDSLPFELAPIYDMLPMGLRPNSQGELTGFQFEPPGQRVEVRDVWRDASQAAAEFWRLAASDPRISTSFHALAKTCLAKVELLISRYN